MTAGIAAEIHRAGDRGWLIDVAPAHIAALVREIRGRDRYALVQDLVPAAASILVLAHAIEDMPELRAEISRVLDGFDSAIVPDGVQGATVVVPVTYDGEDLPSVGEMLGLTPAQIVAAHTGATHRVGFFGFAPGFAYIDGSAACLSLPRRSSPRPRVAAGAVAIAGTQTVVYPGGTPGGWHIIGHTDELLWNVDWDSPSRLAVGDRVVFREVPR